MARLEVKTWLGRDGTALRLYAQRADGSTVGWRRGHLYYGARNQDKPLHTAAWEASRAAQALTQAAGEPVEVSPLLVLQGGRLLFWTRQLHGVRLVGGQLLVPYLRRQPSRHPPPTSTRLPGPPTGRCPPTPARPSFTSTTPELL